MTPSSEATEKRWSYTTCDEILFSSLSVGRSVGDRSWVGVGRVLFDRSWVGVGRSVGDRAWAGIGWSAGDRAWVGVGRMLGDRAWPGGCGIVLGSGRESAMSRCVTRSLLSVNSWEACSTSLGG